MARPKLTVLMALDGFGVAPPGDGNAVHLAKTPNIDRLITTYPAQVIQAAGQEVGLQFGEMGNSEVGHLTLGAGRVMYQNLPRIDRAIENHSFFKNDELKAAIAHAKKHKTKLHLIGIASTGGVHGHLEHLLALLELCKKARFDDVYVHAILDGRDTLPDVAADFIKTAEKAMKKLKVGQIASLSGRYYAMDRDNNWDRTEKAYRAMAEGVADKTATNPVKAIEQSYKQKILDEQFEPTVITDKKDQPLTTINDGDAVIFWNFRSDRARQLTKAFVLPTFHKFERQYLKDLHFTTMMEYEKDLPVSVVFPPENVEQPLAEVLADANLKQLHIAETEKYAHVTFFFNGLKDVVYPGEDDVVIPSPKVSSYDQQPEMSAGKVTTRAIKEIKSDKYDFILLNFANPDMVAHTGNLEATIKALEFLDTCVGQIVDLVLAKEGVVFITADHGNCEEMINLQTGEVLKDHSTNPVPFLMIGKQWEGQTAGLPEGVGADLSLVPPGAMLSDVAPTILKVMEIEQPAVMTGAALL